MARATDSVRQERAAAWSTLDRTLKEQGRSYTWFAAQIGISRKSLWNYLHGENRPPADFIARSARALHVRQSAIAPLDPLERFVTIARPRKPSRNRARSASPTQPPTQRKRAS